MAGKRNHPTVFASPQAGPSTWNVMLGDHHDRHHFPPLQGLLAHSESEGNHTQHLSFSEIEYSHTITLNIGVRRLWLNIFPASQNKISKKCNSFIPSKDFAFTSYIVIPRKIWMTDWVKGKPQTIQSSFAGTKRHRETLK